MHKFSLLFSILIVVITVICYPLLPATIPIHWNFSGQIDGYGHKITLVVLSFLPLLMYGLMSLTKKMDPNAKDFDTNSRGYQFIKDGTTYFMCLIVLICLMAGFNEKLDVATVIQMLVGLMLMVVGNYIPTVPKNYFLGARTPWALNDEDNWKKTQRVSGYSFIIIGLCLFLSGITKWKVLSILAFVLLFVSCIFVYFYSYYLFKKGKQ